ncbi:MAG: hypothetical protein Ct9H300mP28_21260 [Pseudomonadota bacterium]|nr:MAG: hypothetical protein Ct9H300mP28_21260 [Pseudomonadota bacterium]
MIMNWDIQINEEIDLLRETVRQFAEKNIASIADEIDRNNEFPKHLWTELGKLGLLGITVPESFGGSGMSYLANLIAVEENFKSICFSRFVVWGSFKLMRKSAHA